jgi:hypothetical protein
MALTGALVARLQSDVYRVIVVGLLLLAVAVAARRWTRAS